MIDEQLATKNEIKRSERKTYALMTSLMSVVGGVCGLVMSYNGNLNANQTLVTTGLMSVAGFIGGIFPAREMIVEERKNNEPRPSIMDDPQMRKIVLSQCKTANVMPTERRTSKINSDLPSAKKAVKFSLDQINFEALKMEEHELADMFICPISKTFMRHPVMAQDGNTYDLVSLETWYFEKKEAGATPFCPLNPAVELLEPKTWIPNGSVAGAIYKASEQQKAKLYQNDERYKQLVTNRNSSSQLNV